MVFMQYVHPDYSVSEAADELCRAMLFLLPLCMLLGSPAVASLSRNFLPLSFFCFKTRHLVTAMLLATVESKSERN